MVALFVRRFSDGQKCHYGDTSGQDSSSEHNEYVHRFHGNASNSCQDIEVYKKNPQ